MGQVRARNRDSKERAPQTVGKLPARGRVSSAGTLHLTTAGGTSKPWGNASSDHCWKNFPQIRTVITVCVRFDCMKYSGEHAAGDDSDNDSNNRATYTLGIAMLVFRISSSAFARPPLLNVVQPRDFCFVRQMKPADRKGAGSVGPPTTANQQTTSSDVSGRGIPRLADQFPRFLPWTRCTRWGQSWRTGKRALPNGAPAQGCTRTKFPMDNRTRPPFTRRCLCLGPEP